MSMEASHHIFQLQPSDLAPEFNMDYSSNMPTEDRRGDYPYYLPIGWHRHALKVVDKYPEDQLWLRSDNIEGEWPVAFHGTHSGAVKGITKEGLRKTRVDLMREESAEQRGKDFDRPGLYVATHCDGGAYPNYTKPFSIKTSSDITETFRVVFQCRVKPDAFTTHSGPVRIGNASRFVDSDAIRPNGILLKKEQ